MNPRIVIIFVLDKFNDKSLTLCAQEPSLLGDAAQVL